MAAPEYLIQPQKTINGIISTVNGSLTQLPYKVQRRDEQVANQINNGGKLRLELFGDIGDIGAVNEAIYVDDYDVTGIITVYSNALPNSFVDTDIDYDAGKSPTFANFIGEKTADYRLLVRFYDDAGDLAIQTIFNYQTANNGIVFFDVKDVINPLFEFAESFRFEVRVQNFYDGQEQGIPMGSGTVQAIQARRQVGDEGGSNVWDWLLNPSPLGRVLTAANTGFVWRGWRRTASCIYDAGVPQRITGGNVRFTVRELDINKGELSKLESAIPSTFDVQTIEIPEDRKDGSFVGVLVEDVGTDAAVTAEVFYEVLEECDRPIYLEWRNSLGALDQHLFSIQQQVSEDTILDLSFNPEINDDIEFEVATMRRRVIDWKQRIQVTAENLTFEHLRMLKEIKISNEVYVYLQKDGSKKIRTRITSLTNTEYVTRPKGKAWAISVELEMPDNFDLFNTPLYMI